MSLDLNAMSRSELKQLRKDVDKALSTLEKRERKAAIAAAEEAAAKHGFSLSDLSGSAPKGKAAPKNPPKYRNSEDATQTWSGRGRKPDWIKAAEAAGTDLSTFEI